MKIMKIAIIGTGYVGLVTGTCFAHKGHDVICVDVIQEKVDMINQAIPPIFEEGLEEMLKQVVEEGKLEATLDFKEAIQKSEIIFICVGTPSFSNGLLNDKYVRSAATSIAKAFEEGQEYKVVVVKSTCNPGTTTDIVKPILENSKLTSGKDFGVGMNPEFLREGVALKDFLAPDRIVIGGNDERAQQLIAKTYEGFEAPILQVDPTTAEIIKLASNSFLAMKISFINEIANIAEKIGSDVSSIAQGVGMDERISNKFLRAGLGYGGSCFPKDVSALYQKSKELKVPSKLLEATIETNKIQPLRAIQLLKETYDGESLKDKKIAILGLAFKPDTDDVRDAVSVPIIEMLLEEGAIVYATDPIAMKNFEKEIENENLHLVFSIEEVLKSADGCILITEWKEFKDISPDRFLELMRNPVLIDGRRAYDHEQFIGSEVKYKAIGLGSN